jgi:hypothetical protein
MKKILIFSTLFCFASSFLYSQTEEELVNQIRKQFAQTNENSSQYKVVEVDLYDESTEGGKLKAFQDSGQTVLIQADYYGEMGHKSEQYYLCKEILYFAYWVEEQYDKPIFEEDFKVLSKNENRYYFNNNKMIRWLDNTKTKQNKNTALYEISEKIVLNECQSLLEKLKK